MAEALKTFREGEDILASETNENNQYLLSKLSDNAAQVQSYVEGEVATIKSNVASVQATLQNNIDLVKELVQAMYTNLMPDYSKGVLIESGYTAPSAGFVTVYGSYGNTSATGYVYVNGNEVGCLWHWAGGGDGVGTSFNFLVDKDDVITWSNFNWGSRGYFYPLKGVANDD